MDHSSIGDTEVRTMMRDFATNLYAWNNAYVPEFSVGLDAIRSIYLYWAQLLQV